MRIYDFLTSGTCSDTQYAFYLHVNLRDVRLGSIRTREPNEILINVPPNDDKKCQIVKKPCQLLN